MALPVNCCIELLNALGAEFGLVRHYERTCTEVEKYKRADGGFGDSKAVRREIRAENHSRLRMDRGTPFLSRKSTNCDWAEIDTLSRCASFSGFSRSASMQRMQTIFYI